jgi:hypothetical protein
MKEITEGGITYCVSDTYPETPYVKYVKTEAAAVAKTEMQIINEKLDSISAELITVKTQTKK